MLSAFLIVGLIFIIYEFWLKKKDIKLSRELSSFTYKEAIFVGTMQALAVVPGVSRAGAVILAMMFIKFKRFEAAKFSFLLAMPTIIAASLLDIVKLRSSLSSGGNIELLLIGFVVSFVVALVVVKWFISFLQKHSLASFGWYRITAGLLLILFGIK
jgi:undecaprenyl-diphosphatase